MDLAAGNTRHSWQMVRQAVVKVARPYFTLPETRCQAWGLSAALIVLMLAENLVGLWFTSLVGKYMTALQQKDEAGFYQRLRDIGLVIICWVTVSVMHGLVESTLQVQWSATLMRHFGSHYLGGSDQVGDGAFYRLQLCECARLLSTKTKTTIQGGDFNELRERALLRHVINTATEGDPDSVMGAMDTFWDTYFNGEGTAEWQLRGSALDSAIRTKQPKTAMEIGAYCGYTAVRMGRLMPPGGQLVSIEMDPLYAAIATKMVEYAGLSERVSVEIGFLSDRLAAIHRKHGLSGPLDAVLLDHDTSSYLPDLQMLEQAGHISKATVVLCDWSLYPGSDESAQVPIAGSDFMQYLDSLGVSQSTSTSMRDKQIFTVSAGDWVGAV